MNRENPNEIRRIGILGLAMMGLVFQVWGQVAEPETQNTTPSEWWIGTNLSSKGIGGNFYLVRGYGDTQWFYGVDFFSVKGRRESKIDSNFGDDGRKFIYGKQNNLTVISPTFGISKKLFSGGYGDFVFTRLNLSAGPAIGLINPYYIETFEPAQSGQPFLFYRVVTTFDPEKHAYEDIFGKANLFSSTSKIDPSFQFGLSLRSSAILDFVRNPRYISGIQVGFNADFFFNEVPVMAKLHDESANDRFFLAGYIGIIFGSSKQ